MLKNLLQLSKKQIITAVSVVTAVIVIALILWGWRMGAMSIMPLDIYYC